MAKRYVVQLFERLRTFGAFVFFLAPFLPPLPPADFPPFFAVVFFGMLALHATTCALHRRSGNPMAAGQPVDI